MISTIVFLLTSIFKTGKQDIMLKVIQVKRGDFRQDFVRLLTFIITIGILFPMSWYIYLNARSLELTEKLLYDAIGDTKVVLRNIKTFTTLPNLHMNMQNNVDLNPTLHTGTKKTFEQKQEDMQQKYTGWFSESFHFIINNEDICKASNESIDILIMITSSPQNKLSRNAIRETWLTHTKMNKGNIRYVFLLGESPMTKELEKENLQTKDIILGNFKDAYNNLTYKTLMGYQWATQHCRNAQFVMKTDDDMYVHIPGLIRVTKKNAKALQTAIGGSCALLANPIRDKRSKWYASFKSYPQTTYPGFCSGTGYVTSLNVVTKIVKTSKDVPFFHLEDVYVALCIKKLGLRLHPIGGFVLAYNFGNCTHNDNTLVTVHQVSVSMLKRIWETPCTPNKV
ncbi:beta-1,3-galactosyltransferase 1-like isoform X1 [Mytilus edulis]|uniref:beta-1,3-galactosyltransferase 1-like isoform X1 n=2 Tax=Mytilus edulis TaxID=6550 RepID=UPI0039F129F5